MLHRERKLTSRERNVLMLLCTGHTNQDICKRLHIANNSLIHYLVSIRKKLGVSQLDETHPAVRRVRLAIAYWKSIGLRVPDKPHKIEGLTDEEAKIAYMVATGETNKAIIDSFEDVTKYPQNFLADTMFGTKYNIELTCAKRVIVAKWYWDRFGVKVHANSEN